MPTILQIIKGTPYWAWIVLIYLLLIGIEALKDRQVSLFRIAIMPIIFISWSLVSLYNKTTFSLALYPFTWAIGIGLGFLFIHKLKLVINKNTGLITIPGSVIPLAISCSFFLFKYCLGVTYALNPAFKFNIIVTGFDAGISGIISGFSFGRFLNSVYEYRKQMAR